MDSTNHRSTIFRKKNYVVTDMYYAVRPTTAASIILNVYRLLFLSLFPKHYSTTTIYNVLGIKSNLEIKCTEGGA